MLCSVREPSVLYNAVCTLQLVDIHNPPQSPLPSGACTVMDVNFFKNMLRNISAFSIYFTLQSKDARRNA